MFAASVTQREALFGIVAGVAFLCAWFAPKGQRAASGTLASLFVANWLLYAASFTDYHPAGPFWSVGWYIRNEDIWAFADAVTALLALALARRFWWGWAIWSLYVVQSIMHMLANDFAILPVGVYNDGLDATFLMVAACFIVIGGEGLFSVVRRGLALRWFRGMGSTSLAPSRRVAS